MVQSTKIIGQFSDLCRSNLYSYLHLCSACRSATKLTLKPVQAAGEYLSCTCLCSHCGRTKHATMYKVIEEAHP